MILNLIISRHGLAPARVRWNTSSFSPTHSATSDANPTIAELVSSVSEIVPLESADYGLEDYAVEVNGFECLHFCRVSQVLKDEDKVTIRPWQTQEVRLRTLSGRRQISSDGRHLIDGVSFGRSFMRRGLGSRPGVRIAPKVSGRADQQDENSEDGDLDEPMGLLMDSQPNRSVEDEIELDDQEELYLQQPQFALTDQAPDQFNTSNTEQPYGLAQRNTSQALGSKKRRLEPAFEDARIGKRLRSALHSQGMRKPSIASSTGSKNVRFHESTLVPPYATSENIIRGDSGSDDESEDEDYDTESEEETSSSDEDSESESDKENINPRDHQVDPHRTPPPVTLTSSTKDRSPLDNLKVVPIPVLDVASSSSISSSEPASSSEVSSSEVSSSEDDSSSASGGREIISKESPKPLQSSKAQQAIKPVKGRVPPGLGNAGTKLRNKRRRESAKLLKLKEEGILQPDATLQDLRNHQSHSVAEKRDSLQEEFESSRQALLEALANGGIDITTESGHRAEVLSEDDSQAVVANDQRQGNPSKQQRGQGPVESTAKLTGAEGRRRLDLGASQRLVMGGIGLRVPKSKADEENLREQSRQRAQQEVEKHHKRAGQAHDDTEAEAAVEETWQDYIDLQSVECADTSVQYSTPPFPFQQRWDQQQHWNNWRPKGNKKQKTTKRKRYDADIEEHYDAAMYDEPVNPSGHDTEVMATVDSETIPEGQTIAMPLDVSDNVDLLLEQAAVGARIAFKRLEISEATGWSPNESTYMSGTVVSNDDGAVVVLLDEQFRVQKEIDPDTGEVIGSRFIIADAQDDEDTIEVNYTEMIQPKLLQSAQVTPVASQQNARAHSPLRHSTNLIDALAQGGGPRPAQKSSRKHAPSTNSIDEGDDTAVEVSFGASTQTIVEAPGDANPPKKTAEARVADIDPDARNEASLLIREAGFRSIIDPEATRPLEDSGAQHAELVSAHIGQQDREQTDFRGFSSPGMGEDDESPMSDFATAQGETAGMNNHPDYDLVSLQDSSLEMVTDFLPGTNSDAMEIEVGTPDSVIHRRGVKSNLAKHILTGNGSTREESRQGSPDAAPIEPGSVKEVANSQAKSAPVDSQESLPLWETLLHNEPGSGSNKEPLEVMTQPTAKSRKSPQGKARKQQSKNSRRIVSLTQPEPSRNTRRTARRATAVANTITLSDDDEGDDEDRMSSLPPSTAPAASAAPPNMGFTAINMPPTPAPSRAKRPANAASPVDLTALPSDPVDMSSEAELPNSPLASQDQAARRSFAGFEKFKQRKSDAMGRSKSKV